LRLHLRGGSEIQTQLEALADRVEAALRASS